MFLKIGVLTLHIVLLIDVSFFVDCPIDDCDFYI